MADLSNDASLHTIYGYSTQESAFIEAIETKVAPFYLAVDQVDEALSQYIDANGAVSYTLRPLNEQVVTQPLTGPLNCNGKRVENIGVVPDLSSIDSILASGNTAVNVNTMSTYVNLFSALNLILANPLLQQTVGMKGLRLINAGDAQLPIPTDAPEILAEKNKAVMTIGQQLQHFPTDIMSTRDPLDVEMPNRPFFNCNERIMQRALDPIVDQDLVTLKFLKDITLNRGGPAGVDFDAATRRISSLLEPEEVKEIQQEQFKALNLARAINQKFLRDTAITRLQTQREIQPGVFEFNTVFDAKSKIIQSVANAIKDADALPFGQAKSKFLTKDGDTIDVNAKRCVNGVEAVDDTDLVIKSQLDDLDDELRDLIDNLGGGGNSVLDIVSLFLSLTSLASSLASLSLKAGSALTAVVGASQPLLNGVLALASVLKDAGGQVVGQTVQKVANAASLDDYAPDPQNPQNWAEQQADLDRMRQAARDVESSASRPVGTVGASWLNGIFESALSMQRQILSPFETI